MRASGILLPVFSLPGKYGIGCFSKEAYEFVDFLEKACQMRKAYERSKIYEKEDFHIFKEENAYWLRDYAMFMAIKSRFDGDSFDKWAEDIRLRWGYSMEYYQTELYYEIEFYEYIQYEFYKQ